MTNDKQAFIQQFLPELTQPSSWTQEDIITALGKLALERVDYEKKLQLTIDRFFHLKQENDNLQKQLETMKKKS
jgi:hypothetical protein